MSDVTTDQGGEGHETAKAVARRARPPGNRKEDWIGENLRRVYDGAVGDAIPSRMLDLLNALDDDGETPDTLPEKDRQ